MISRLAASALPRVNWVERQTAPVAPTLPRGCAIGTNRRGDAVLLDLPGQQVCRYDLATQQRGDGVAIAAAQDPLTPGLVAVDDEGGRALVMACQSPHGDPALLLIDLAQRTATSVRSFGGPGWIAGGFTGRGLLACEQHLDEAPLFAIHHVVDGTSKKIFASGGMAQPCVPCALEPARAGAGEAIAFLCCLQPDPMTRSGPMSLCLVDLATAAVVALAAASGSVVRTRPGMLVVEGGPETVRVAIDR